jgi:hypothetical protein
MRHVSTLFSRPRSSSTRERPAKSQHSAAATTPRPKRCLHEGGHKLDR